MYLLHRIPRPAKSLQTVESDTRVPVHALQLLSQLVEISIAGSFHFILQELHDAIQRTQIQEICDYLPQVPRSER